MGQALEFIDFYQLAGDETAELAAQLAEKCIGASKKVVIHAPKEACEPLSRALWVLRDFSFLAHGIDGADGSDYADIWISSDVEKNQISAEYAILLSGRVPDDITAYERCFIIFNGKDETSLQTARAQWKQMGQSYQGCCRYFAKRDDGRWEQKASA